MFIIIFSCFTAFLLSYLIIPPIIQIAKAKNLCDHPGERHSHTVITPSLGGIAIFAGLLFSTLFWTPSILQNDFRGILCAFLIVFLIGVKDDIMPLSPLKKLLGQLLAASILVFKSNIKINSLFGLLGIYELPEVASICLSIFTILVIINAFNLIDGINGLSGSISVLITATAGIWFYLMGQMNFAILAFATVGAVLAFLRYNVTPAKIFMGDTGALLLGVICSIITIKFIDLHYLLPEHPYAFNAAPAVAFGVLILPLFDTLRVFITRIANGRSPLQPDRTHIHHLLIDVGFSHMKATLCLVVINIAFIVLVITFQHIGTINLLLLILGTATILSGGLYFSAQKKLIEGME